MKLDTHEPSLDRIIYVLLVIASCGLAYLIRLIISRALVVTFSGGEARKNE